MMVRVAHDINAKVLERADGDGVAGEKRRRWGGRGWARRGVERRAREGDIVRFRTAYNINAGVL